MPIKDTLLAYSGLLLTSTKKSFEALGKTIRLPGKAVAKLLKNCNEIYDLLERLAFKEFSNKKELVLIFDETLIRKIYSRLMVGTAPFYDTQLFRRIIGYKLLVALLTDGKLALPFKTTFLFPKELLPNPKEEKIEWIKKIILHVIKIFPKTKIIVAADGAFASKEFLNWCIANLISAEVRIRNNSRVEYKERLTLIRDIQELLPKGRQMARTISVLWHGIPLFITAQRRIDKRGKETIVYQAATFSAKPKKHVKIYRARWRIEQMFRTSKQYLGLQECFSRNIEIQKNHVASVFFAYALAHCDSRNRKLPNPEASINRSKLKNRASMKHYMKRLDNIIERVYA